VLPTRSPFPPCIRPIRSPAPAVNSLAASQILGFRAGHDPRLLSHGVYPRNPSMFNRVEQVVLKPVSKDCAKSQSIPSSSHPPGERLGLSPQLDNNLIGPEARGFWVRVSTPVLAYWRWPPACSERIREGSGTMINVLRQEDEIVGAYDECPTGGAIRGIVLGFGLTLMLWGGIAWAVVQAVGK
jgi:hypothetical protein